MRILELLINGKSIKSKSEIDKLLTQYKLYWLIDSEIENAVIEIKNNTLIWYSGEYYSGNWYYGIFKSGIFYGVFMNGIFEGGDFKGVWKSGINLN